MKIVELKGQPVVKKNMQQGSESSTIQKNEMQQVTAKPSDLQRLLNQKNMKLSPQILKELEFALQKITGTMEQKLNTLSIMADHRITISAKHFHAVFQALHGPGLDQLLQESFNVQPNLLQVLTQPVNEQPLTNTQDLHDLLDQTLSKINSGEKVALPQLQNQLQQYLERGGPNFQENKGLADVHRQLSQHLQLPSDEMKHLLINMKQALQTVQEEIQAKTFVSVERQVTPQMERTAKEFQEIKGQLQKNVDQMVTSLQSGKKEAVPLVERMLKPTIDGLNKLINKGDFALHADMEFEHDILKMSGELRNIKELIQQGKTQEALKGFQAIQKQLEKLDWQPAKEIVQQMFSKSTNEIMKNPLEHMAKDWNQGKLSARGVQEWIRTLGLNHESDAVKFLLQQDRDPLAGGKTELPHQNLKSLLMQSLEQEMSPKAKTLLESAISHINGLQLLSKQDPEVSMQSLYVQLPLPWKEGTERVEMQIKSRSNGKQLDWENCHIFFFLDTPKYGETGISLQILNREIHLQIQNDHKGIKEAYQPFLPEVKERLESMGYHLNNVSFESTKQNRVHDVKTSSAKAPLPTHKGVDLSI